ncbi:MAG: 23S rRNA pseudouridine(1911/1915/1917) synthase RluD [Proteobacteria bacterium]|nr:23S rRNA pseudouridine(1911/1915/1917) synthase RluD [Pseudomonadota bacterium]
MSSKISLKAEVPQDLSGYRLDQIAAKLFPDYSRARLQIWIKDGSLLVNARQLRPRDRLHSGDKLEVNAELPVQENWSAEPMALDIVFEDDCLIIVNKPANVVVHPASGHADGTLLNGLLHHHNALQQLPRAGIVHRLDKDTTGLMVVAKTLASHAALVNQMQARDIARQYEAVVQGVLTGGGTVDAALGRHPVNRKKRAVVEMGQRAVSHYRVIRRYRSHTHLEVKLDTGRTHQIRVHMAHLNHPVVGDPMYGGRQRVPAACSAELINCLKNFKRQALHACRLALHHPGSGKLMSWESATPPDMVELICELSKDVQIGADA